MAPPIWRCVITGWCDVREMLRTNPQVVTEQWLCETLDPILLALQELHNEKCPSPDIAPTIFWCCRTGGQS